MSFIIYEDDALVVLDKPAGCSSEEEMCIRDSPNTVGVGNALCRHTAVVV